MRRFEVPGLDIAVSEVVQTGIGVSVFLEMQAGMRLAPRETQVPQPEFAAGLDKADEAAKEELSLR